MPIVNNQLIINLDKYEPLLKQELFHQSLAKYRLYIGAWRAGKTYAGCMEAYTHSFTYPKNCGIIFRKDYCLDINTPIPTVDGWKTMGDLEVGDKLFDETGKIINVSWVSSTMKNHLCYRIDFSDGSFIIADEEHKWITTTRDERIQQKRRTPEWRKEICIKRRPNSVRENHNIKLKEPTYGSIKTTKQILETLKLNTGEVNHAIDVCHPLQILDKALPINPYVLGVWLGDGTSIYGAITCNDKGIIREIEEEGYVVNKQKSYLTWNIEKLRTQLRLNGLLGNKHIPSIYLRGSFNQRLSLLQGLMDTDGSVSNGQCCLGFVSRRLIDDTVELIRSLGIKTQIHSSKRTLYGKVCKDFYRINFSTSLEAFRLKRKLDLQKRSKFNGKQGRYYVVNITPVDSVPVKCIKVDSVSNCFLAGTSFIKTHNTDLRDTTMKTFFEIVPSEDIIDFNKSEHKVTLRNGSEIYFRHLKDGLKLGSLNLGWFFIDEAEEVTEEIFITLQGRLSLQNSACVGWLVSNPPNTDHWLYKTFNESQDKDFVVFYASTYENKEHLPQGYIENLEKLPPSWRKKYLDGQWGFTPDGKPFYQGFIENIHKKKLEFKPQQGNILYRSWDYGFHYPACSVHTFDARGRWLILKEIMGQDITIEKFGDYVKLKCKEWYPECAQWIDYGDPAGMQKTDKSEKTSVEILASLGISVVSKQSTFRERKEIIERKLSILIDGIPSLVVDESCKIIVDGFLGGYHYPVRKSNQAFNPAFMEIPYADGYYQHLLNTVEYFAVNQFAGSETKEDKTEVTYRTIGIMKDIHFEEEDSENYSKYNRLTQPLNQT